MKTQLLNNRMVVTFEGDVLSTSVDLLRASFAKLQEGSPTWTELELDLTAAKMMDSAGLNLVTSVIKAVKTRGVKVTARIASKTVHRIFLFTRLDKHVELIVEDGA
ncbi:STAS domain-containing protein [Nibricoccus sp. IMCC34717]|uniref:STAS domain-containing protein n=1 Tax=Nibricoccus sp. IMCC34717 TaxID=3034021 RepID=UPI00384E5832